MNPPPFPGLESIAGIEPARDAVEDVARSTIIHSRSFAAGHVLFAPGDERDNAYLIDSGTVELFDADGAVLCALGPGEIFGEMALMDTGARTAGARVAALADIFVIPRSVLKNKMAGMDPVLSLLIGILIDRYRHSRIAQPESVSSLSDRDGQKDAALKELRITQDIRRGLERDEFIPVLQPILSLPDRTVAGFEILVRWNHPERGLLTPNHFIPAAERSGIIQDLDNVMLRRACALLPQFLNGAADDFFISVNLSGINFETLDVIQNVRAALIEGESNPRHIKLEITESALIADPDRAEQVLKGLKALGVGIALDDFGTGYSSLGYLHRFPIDALKIDRSFVSQLQDHPRSLDIIRAIVALARNFHLGVVAEGIETEQDSAAINALGVDMGQGYLFGRPMAVEDALAFLGRKS